ncbi:MAG: hypothetical protein ACK4SY_02870 [Pyrobaculum sp.]
MNLTLEFLSTLVVVFIGAVFLVRIQYDYRLVKIFKNFPLPPTVRPQAIVDLDKLYIFVQNFRYDVRPEGSVEVEVRDNKIKVLSGVGQIAIVFEAWGYFDLYRVKRVIRVASV